MARDLDFVPRRQRVQTQPQPQAVVNQKSAPAPRQSRSSTMTVKQAGLWLIIIILVVLGIWGLWQYFKPVAKTATPALTAASTNTGTEVTPTDNNLFATKSDKPVVQVYDSGAGNSEVAKLISLLKALGYQAENLDKSQFDYDKTYIWYQAGLVTEAQKIQSAMPNRDVTLKETKIAGTFDILVLLGSK